MKIQHRFALSIIAFLIGTQAFADGASPYPSYTSAAGIPANQQVKMEALWLHLTAHDTGLPKSFDANDYWSYMAANNADYQLYLHGDKSGTNKPHDNGTCTLSSDGSNDATIERILQDKGLDIYDGAVWQIAMAIAAKSNSAYLTDVENFKNFLTRGVGSDFSSHFTNNNYSYNGATMLAPNAYMLKFISSSWAHNYDGVNNCEMNWPEWSAVTGEEAWAALIGPVQSAYLINDGAHNPNWSTVSQASSYIQIGKNALPAIVQMKSPSGGVYRNVALPGQPQNLDVSLENNISLYAGLGMLENALVARKNSDAAKLKLLKTSSQLAATATLQSEMDSDEKDIATIISLRKDLVQYFTGHGGIKVINDDDKDNVYFLASTNESLSQQDKTFAVDVQTWGATVFASSKKESENDADLLQAMKDTYGNDIMFKILQTAINKGGYRDNTGHLLGVGYTEQKPTDKHYVLSGEWTFGAVNAAIVLAKYYQTESPNYSSTLIQEAKDMLAGVTAETSALQGSSSSETSRLSYLYANKRTWIPFGWYANKSPATASTAWSLMVNSCYNPLELGGGNYQDICKTVGL